MGGSTSRVRASVKGRALPMFEGSSMTCEVIEIKDDGNRLIRFHYDKGTNFFTELDKIGQMPPFTEKPG